MNKRGKHFLLFSLLALVVISIIFIFTFNFIFAADFTGQIVNGSTINSYNLSVGEQNITILVRNTNTSVNITHVNITLPTGFTFTKTSNTTNPATSADSVLITGEANFTYDGNTLIWLNSTQAVINGSSPPTGANARAFGIYVNATAVGGTYGINVTTVYSDGILNSTNLSITVRQDITAPTVQLLNATDSGYEAIGTLNGSVFNTTATINFSCNMTDFLGLYNVTLFLQGVQAPTFSNSSVSISGTYNQTNYTHTFSQPGTFLWYCQVRDTSGNVQNSPSNKITVNAFSFSGWVKMANFTNATGANVSIYEFVQAQQGPPSQRIIKSTTTGAGGNFTLSDVQNNGSMSTIYKVKVTLNNSDGLVTEVGPNLPQMPREPLAFSMNGGTFYMQNATTIQLYAYNNITYNGTNPGTNPSLTRNLSKVKFGYEVIDQALGFPIESNVQGGFYTANVSVPANRNYTVMFVRDPYSFVYNDQNYPLCEGPGYMNETSCPSPPSSVSITSDNIISLQNSTEINSTNYIITINKSLAFSQYNLTGCLNIAGNTTDVNVSDIIAKMIPWEGFIPPMKGEVSDFDSSESSSFAYGLSGSGLNKQRGCTLGAFNLTIMGSATGIKWLIEAYAQANTTPTGEYFAAFQNFTQPGITGEKVFNLTLVRLLGAYVPGRGDVNTSKVEVAIMDSNGTAPQNAHVEVYVKNPVFGTMHYMIETLTNGKFNFTLLNNTQEARVMVFSNQYAPKETKISLSANRTNVTLYSFRPMKMLDNGSVSDSKMSGSSMTMKFMRYSSDCNIYTPASSCQIGSDNTADFDPLKAMMAGKSNLWMKTSSNVTLYFINVDMMASGPPDAMMNDNASSATGGANSDSVEQIWKFGSMAPDVYDEVRIGIPYNSSVNENLNYTINFSLLYDNDWNVIWNATVNTTAQLPSDYSDFNTTWFGTPGMPCTNASATTTSCFLNTTNTSDGHSGYFWFTIPHFSSTATKVKGSTVTAATTTSGGGSGGGGGSTGTIYDAGTLATAVSEELSAGDKITFTIDNRTHKLSLLGMTGSSAVIQITAIRITLTKTFKVGDVQLIDVTEDNINDIEVTLKSINLTKSKAVFEVRSLAVAAPSAPVTPGENVTALCGNGVVETGENCQTCPADVKCAADEECKNAVCAKKTAPLEKKPVMKWVLITSIIVIAAILVFLMIKLKKTK